jgi:hypothetical protein
MARGADLDDRVLGQFDAFGSVVDDELLQDRSGEQTANVTQHDSGLSPIRRDHHDRRLLAGAEIRPINSEAGELRSRRWR